MPSRSPWRIVAAFALLCATLLLPMAGQATTLIPPPPALAARGYLLMDPYSGRVLAASNETQRLEPASLTKLMTAYVAFDALRAGRLRLDQLLTISSTAWKQEGSRTFVEPGMQVSVEDLLKGMIVQSGNDAAVALAEAIAGSEPSFAELMNLHSRRLGMAASHWMNATGLPHPEHHTTARDLGLLAAAIIREFPQYYRYYALREFTFNGITQQNRNGLLARDPSVDGIKTGHTESAGYCLASSAQRQGMRLVAVVLGTASTQAREDASAALLNWGFSFYESRRVAAAGKSLRQAEVFKSGQSAAFGVRRDLWVTVPRGDFARVRVAVSLPPALVAPLAMGTAVGQVVVSLDGQRIATAPLHPLQPVPAGNVFRRAWDSLRLIWH
ncbi:MAG: D-alanyl-D-alanine carboxypeptidase family protein [Gammaproteobacteria bacterium]